MPGLVGGFGNLNFLFKFFIYKNQKSNDPISKLKNVNYLNSTINNSNNYKLDSYLAGLIEGDGTFAISFFFKYKYQGLFTVYGVRYFSSSSRIHVKKNIKPIKKYSNSDTQKQVILKDNKNKSGIYR
jgi:hypothetical protein